MSDYIIPEEILKWLPVKPILRCRCVCKRWKEIIDSPLFQQQHLSVQKSRLLTKYQEPELLSIDPGTVHTPISFWSGIDSIITDDYFVRNSPVGTLPAVENLSLPSPFYDSLIDQDKTFYLVGTLHGVVCLYDNFHNFLIWNPSIRKFSSILLPELDFDWDDDDVEELPYFGFWIDPIKKHFEIIMFKLVHEDDPNGLIDGILYSSVDQEWNAVPLAELKDLRPYAESPPVMIDGVAYWRANYDYTDENGKEFLNILVLSYEFSSESFDRIQVPGHTQYNGRYHPILCSLQDTLALVYWEIEESDRFDVFVCFEDDWMNIMAIKLPIDPETRVLWVLGEDEETCRVVAATDEELLLFDDRELWHSMKTGLKGSAKVCVAGDFVESLIFL